MKHVVFLLVLAVIVSLAGCAKKEAAAAGGPVTIEQWGWNAGEIEKIFAAYKVATGAELALNYQAVQQQEVFQKLQTVVSAGLDVPDIIPSEIGQRGTMLGLDIWSDLEKAPFNYDANTFHKYFNSLCRNERGELVCLPWDVSSAGLAYKRDLAEQYLGTSDPDELMKRLPTWDAFVQEGVKLQQSTGGKIFMFASLTNIYQIASGQNPQPIIQNNRLNMTPVRATLEVVARFRDNKTADNIVGDTPAYNASFVDDTHIFYPCAGWTPNYQIMPNDPNGPTHIWGLMVPPEGMFSWGGSGHLVPKNAKHAMEGFQFASWLISYDGAKWESDNLAYNNTNVELYQDPAYANVTNSFFGDQNLGAIFYGAIDTINVRPVSVYDVAIQDTFNLVIEQLNSDRNLTAASAVGIYETELRNKTPDVQ
ncbi:MAG: ABC transporter substrate-binding protein [Treponema sp.]|jgi:multiple sugar transport system substrate-binding protein|nr:ABC transporter substrate-binding protein [Treponema sp.]